MSGSETSKALHGNLSAAAYFGWKRFAEHEGVTMSALLEAFGLALASKASPEQVTAAMAAADARRISAARRNRQ